MEHALPQKEEEYLIDEIERILERAEPDTMARSLEIMYPKIKGEDPLSFLLLFIQGLKESDFFEYAHLIKSLNGRRSKTRHPD